MVVASLLPVGVPVGFAFVVVAGLSTGAAIGLEFFDRQFGLTDKLNAFAHGIDDTIFGRLYRFFQGVDDTIKIFCYEDMVEITNVAEGN